MISILKLLHKNREFRLLGIGELVAFMGTTFSSVALPYQVYHQTHSTLMIGLLSLCQLIPLLFTALLGGVWADRYSRQHLRFFSVVIMVIGALALGVNALLPHPSLILLFIAASLITALFGIDRPASAAILQQVVPKEDFAAASMFNLFTYSAGSIIGPALGGVVIDLFGVVANYFIDMTFFLLSLILIMLMRPVPMATTTEQTSAFAALKQGYLYAKNRQELLGTYFVDFFAMITAMPTALFPAIASHFGNAKVLGLLYAATAVGSLGVSLFPNFYNRVKRHGRAIAIAASFWGIFIIAFGFSTHSVLLMLLFLILAGAADSVSAGFRGIMWNNLVPNTFRGRLAGIEMISYLSGPKLGDTRAGLFAAAFGITSSILSGGVLCIIGVGLCCYFMPKFYHYKTGNDSWTSPP